MPISSKKSPHFTYELSLGSQLGQAIPEGMMQMLNALHLSAVLFTTISWWKPSVQALPPLCVLG